jgi:AcrR family transcriptional regulator
VVSAEPDADRLGAVPRSAAQARTMHVALELFAEHGVSATSYQMIADVLGVTKAAVYHQFKTKNDLIIAVTEMELVRLEDAMEAAESERDPVRARELLLDSVIEHAVGHRRAATTLIFDPMIVKVLSEHLPFQRFVERVYGTLVGDRTSQAAQVRLAMLSCAIGGTVAHPLVAGVDTETLRAELLAMARKIIDLPG